MIRLDRVELLHWDIQPHQILPLALGVTLITGENGSGKTSILDAIKVGLGASSRLGGDRSADSYLLKQAKPVAMIRLLVDNRPAPGTRRRPFDPLGEHSQDTVTLAVVFHAEDESSYRRDYYILDGDVVPPLDAQAGRAASGDRRGALPKPLPSLSDYRERLKRVGITPRYLTLLTMPQGQIANLCRRDAAGLFDDLFDIIGGRRALEAWEERLRELGDRQREHKKTEAELEHARRELKLLEGRVREHEDFCRARGQRQTYVAVLPHLKVREAEEHVRDARATLEAVESERSARLVEIKSQDAENAEAVEHCRALSTKVETLQESTRSCRDRLGECERTLGARSQRLEALEDLRSRAAGVVPRAPDDIQSEIDRAEVRLAEGRAAAQERARERATLDAELAEVRRGILPHPADVRAFRDVLHRAGIPHHVLADVLDVDDDEWRPAVEAWLGRYRFAILIQDESSFSDAVALAREHGYAHGILAPDVRGRSPADEESPVTIVRIKEARYRSLLARLLRAVRQADPEPPYAPVPRLELLAKDGFVLSRLEARVARTDRFYLGVEARKRRQAELESRLSVLAQMEAAWSREELDLVDTRKKLAADLREQHDRLSWEAAREEHADVREKVGRLEEQRDALRTELDGLESARETTLRQLQEQRDVATRTETTVKGLHGEIRKLDERIERGRQERARTEQDLGRLEATSRQDLDEDGRDVLAQGRTATVIEALLGELDGRLARFDQDVRDDMLPVNYERQRQDVAAVEERLSGLAADLAETKKAAEEAREQYHQSTRAVFRSYFSRLAESAAALDYRIEGRIEPREDGRFRADVRIGVSDKPLVHHDSQDLSGGQKAALSILMSMTAVSLESDGAGFFLIDEPFSASDVVKINELGRFLERTRAQYLVSMPTSADVRECGDWLRAFWLCTRGQGGVDAQGRPRLAPPVILGYREAARDA